MSKQIIYQPYFKMFLKLYYTVNLYWFKGYESNKSLRSNLLSDFLPELRTFRFFVEKYRISFIFHTGLIVGIIHLP